MTKDVSIGNGSIADKASISMKYSTNETLLETFIKAGEAETNQEKQEAIVRQKLNAYITQTPEFDMLVTTRLSNLPEERT